MTKPPTQRGDSANRPNVGFVLGPGFHPAELIEVTQAIEKNGFDTAWCSEDYFMTGAIAGAAVMLGATDHLTIGTGVLSTYARHPALTAMEAATLASAYPGRFRLGLGAGSFGALDRQGIAHRRPLSNVRGSVESIRSLLAGDEVSGEYGGFEFDRVRLSYPPHHAPPIYLGATGPKMTALTGEVADGLLLSVFSTPEFIRVEERIMADAAAGPPKPISTFAFLSLDESAEKARARIRPVLAAFLADTESSVMTDAIGITEELRTLVERGGEAGLAANMPDSWVDQLAVCGDLDTCVTRLYELAEAGADEVALAPVVIDSLRHDIEKLAAALRTG